jgi:hypothetical protein
VTAVARQLKASKEALSRLPQLDIHELREEWRFLYKADASPNLSRELLIRRRPPTKSIGAFYS